MRSLRVEGDSPLPARLPASTRNNVVWQADLQLADRAAVMPATFYVWPTARSYTRQPLAEIHTLGSLPLLEGIVRAACAAGARLATPGEFTLRAFLAGRIDLTQAEAVLSVIDAENERGFRAALAQLAGGIATPLMRLRDLLLDLLADLEAGMDFVDEDISFVSADSLAARIGEAGQFAEELRAQLEGRSTASDHPRVVIGGPANVGKSSLFNAFMGTTTAIVHDQAGTTRDYVSGLCLIGPFLVELIDTAGLTTAVESTVDAEAQRRSQTVAERADLLLWCDDSDAIQRPAWDAGRQADLASRTMMVRTKADLSCGPSPVDAGVVCCSSLRQTGLRQLRAEISRRLAEMHPTDAVATTASRCRESLSKVIDALDSALVMVRQDAGDEVIAVDLREALQALGLMVGTVYTDDILDRIFSRFCIGK